MSPTTCSPAAFRNCGKAFDDDARESRVIETIPKGGYRLLPHVEEPSKSAVPLESNRKRVFATVTAAAVLTEAMQVLVALAEHSTEVVSKKN